MYNSNSGYSNYVDVLNRKLCQRISYSLLTLTFVWLMPFNNANAAIEYTLFSTPQDVSRRLDLSSSITGITTPIVVVSANPVSGTAVAVDCGDGSVLCIDYAPNSGFVGTDTFQVTVINDAGAPETARVDVTVGNPGRQNAGLLPVVEVENTLISVCGVDEPPEATLLCQAYRETLGLTPEDLRVMINALSPADVAAQGTMGNELALGQLSNISKHLATLRKGQRLAIGGLVFKQNGQTLTGEMLADVYQSLQSGGAASANSSNSRWGWFLNGNVGGGNQNETNFENGFDFSSNGFSGGMDYRLSADAIVGFALGISGTSLDLQYDLGGLDASGTSMIGYGSFYPTQNSYIDIIMSSNLTKFESTRRIVFGKTDEVAMSENESLATAISLGAGYNAIKGGMFTAAINTKLEYINSAINGYSETGNSPFNVTIAERDVTQLSTSIGTSMTWAISTRNMVLLPQLDINWIHQFKEEADVIEGYFNVDPNQTIFSFNSNVKDEDYAKLEFGVSAVSPAGVTSFFQYGATRGRQQFQNWQIAFGIRFEL